MYLFCYLWIYLLPKYTLNNAGLFNPFFGQLWTNPNVGLKK